MKKIVIFLLAIVGVQCAVNAQRKQSFDEGWRFHRGEVMNAEAVDCDDSQWREVIVPHDFSMEPVAYTHDYREQTTEWKDWQVGPFSRLSIGDFVWTAIDYIGEAGLGHALERSDRGRWIQLLAWPWFNAWCGDIDLVGNKKPQSYYRDVVWGERTIAMAVRPSVTDGEYEDALGWCWTAEENHWNWYEQAYYDGPNKCGYLPVDIRPENMRGNVMNGVFKREQS